MIQILDIYSHKEMTESAQFFLYELLAERKVSESISHKRHPSYQEHVKFVQSKPYMGWYLIMDGEQPVGTCYITKYREVGIWLMSNAKGKGAGKQAMQQLLAMYPGRVFTNTSLYNDGAKAFYEKCGFRACATMLECDNVQSYSDHPGPNGIDKATGQGAGPSIGHAGISLDDKSSQGSYNC